LQTNNVFIFKNQVFRMDVVKESFKRVKEDVEGVKDELAFALKRIAHIEELLNRQAIQQIARRQSISKKKR